MRRISSKVAAIIVLVPGNSWRRGPSYIRSHLTSPNEPFAGSHRPSSSTNGCKAFKEQTSFFTA